MANKDANKSQKPKAAAPKSEAKEKPKKTKEAAPAEAAPVVEKKPEAPREPADPRLKYVKKFHGRFLPRGPLRDRHTALFARWNTEDHGGVTVEELKSLFEDWKVSRQKGPKKKVAAS